MEDFHEELRAQLKAAGLDGIPPEVAAQLLASMAAAGAAGEDGSAAPVEPPPVPPNMEIVEPQVGFCIKTKREDGTKVFANILHSPKIPAPADPSKCPSIDEESVQWRIPLSLGAPRPEKDKAGRECIAYDAVFNSKPVQDAMKGDKNLRAFLADLVIERIQQKHSEQLDRRYKLPNLSYKGPEKPPPHYIRAEKKALVEEIDEQDSGGQGTSKSGGDAAAAAAFAAAAAAARSHPSASFSQPAPSPSSAPPSAPPPSSAPELPGRKSHFAFPPAEKKKTTRTPHYELERPEGERRVRVAIDLPLVDSAADIELDITGYSVSLSVPDRYSLLVILPEKVDEDSGDASWDKAAHRLTVSLDLAPPEEARRPSDSPLAAPAVPAPAPERPPEAPAAAPSNSKLAGPVRLSNSLQFELE
eukprot:tig00000114_g6051.t1